MHTLDPYSRATMEFTLTWRSDEAVHVERQWADPVNCWRDILPPELAQALLGKGPGDRVETAIPAAGFVALYDERKRVRIRPDQFQAMDGNGQPLTPWVGRYYPQGLLRGVSGVFKESTSPCRFLGWEDDRMLFDLNHPLAGRDLKLGVEIVTIHPRQGKERGGRCEDWLERVSSGGPGIQARWTGQESALFAEAHFMRADPQPDALFYRQARLVHHLDSTARAEIGRQYAALIRPGSRVLDLMGSWTSHLPDSLELAGLTVLGLNEEELRHNRQATETLAQDLNSESRLPYAEAHFDAVVCTAAVEYLTNPLAVMAEIRRVLRPGGVLAFAFSNRWFPPKAIRLWTELHEFERLGLVAELFHQTGGFSGVTTLSRRGLPRPLDDPHQELWLSDPLYMVWGSKV